eukprot:1506243-Prymnesium_polylepis.1
MLTQSPRPHHETAAPATPLVMHARIDDLIKSLKLGDGAHGGRRSKNMRWHESTKRIFDVILKL